VAGDPAAFVEAMTEAVSNGEREEADPFVELDVDAPGDPFAERHLDRHQLVLRQHRESLAPLEPGADVLLVDEPDADEPVVESFPERVDDPAVEEDPVRKRVDEEEPHPALGAVPQLPAGARTVDGGDRLGHRPGDPS
jgi:hypothetical protein